MLEKLLGNPISIEILKLLSKKPLTLHQISKILKIKLSIIFAVLGELYHYGLVQQIEPIEEPIENTNKKFNFKEIEHNNPSLCYHQIEISKSSLGIPLSDFISFWEELQKDPNQINNKTLDKLTFTVPRSIISIISDNSSDEIRKKFQ